MSRLGKLQNELLLASGVRNVICSSQYLFLFFFASPLGIRPEVFCPIQ